MFDTDIPAAVWLALGLASSLLGMTWLAVAMDVHWGQVMHRRADQATPARQRLRVLGGMAISASLLACLAADHPSMAVLVWVMSLAVAALAVALTLSRCPRVLRVVVPASGRPE